MKHPSFSFIIVCYNNAETIEPCLDSIAAHTAASYEVALVDNSPNLDTWDAIHRYIAKHSAMKIQAVRPETNIGFGRGCNLGAQLTRGEFLFLLNPDTQLLNDAASRLVVCIEQHPTALAAGPAISDSDGRITKTCRNLPHLGHIILDATGLDRWWGAYKLTRFNHDQPRTVEQIIGAAMLLRRTDWDRLGGMDEQFFIYFEEVDLCKRLRSAGGEVWFWPEARVQHLAGQSCEVGPVHARMIFVLRESRRKYFVKHYGRLGGFALEVVNRLEAVEKLVVLAALWLLRRRGSDRIKAYGFWSVATGIAPRT